MVNPDQGVTGKVGTGALLRADRMSFVLLPLSGLGAMGQSGGTGDGHRLSETFQGSNKRNLRQKAKSPIPAETNPLRTALIPCGLIQSIGGTPL